MLFGHGTLILEIRPGVGVPDAGPFAPGLETSGQHLRNGLTVTFL